MREQLFILPEAFLKEALKQLDKSAQKVLLVVNDEQSLLGTLTDGDIRRYLLKGNDLENKVRDVYNSSPLVIEEDEFSLPLAREMLLKHKVQLIPLVDSRRKVVDFITWDKAFSRYEPLLPQKTRIDVPLVIMAGGKGTRMDPFTRILPKPLIPVGDKPMIEVIIDEFRSRGVSRFFGIINYKGEMIEAYFQHLKRDYTIEFVKENEFRGTAGSLNLLAEKLDDIFIVSNCDVLVQADFADVLALHRSHNAALTVLSSIQHHKIPYGVIEFKEKGEIVDIREKPEYTVTINTGVYVLARTALELIPPDRFFHMTDLIKELIRQGRPVLTYPVNASDYIDIGQWEEYKQSLEKLEFFPAPSPQKPRP